MKVYYAMGQSITTLKPLIRLQNRYLEAMGFNVGDTIEVEYQPQQVIIHRTGNTPSAEGTAPLPKL